MFPSNYLTMIIYFAIIKIIIFLLLPPLLLPLICDVVSYVHTSLKNMNRR